MFDETLNYLRGCPEINWKVESHMWRQIHAWYMPFPPQALTDSAPLVPPHSSTNRKTANKPDFSNIITNSYKNRKF